MSLFYNSLEKIKIKKTFFKFLYYPYGSVTLNLELHEVEPPKTGKRLEEGTQKLSLELMEHVESLRSTLDNMSNR